MSLALRARAANLPSWRQLRTFASRLASGPHRTSTVRAALDAPVVALVLRRRGLGAVLPAPGRAGRTEPAVATEVAAAVDAGMGVLPLAPTCLRRSVTLLRELDRLGLDGGVHIGVRTSDGRIEAHAWVESDGRVINDDVASTESYAEFIDGRIDHLLPLLR